MKAAVLVLITAMGPFVVLGLRSTNLSSLSSSESPTSSSSKSSPASSGLSKSSTATCSTIGGWRVADAKTLARWDTSLCTIERVSVRDLSEERFEREYRYKKPVLITFPHGARDWTDPSQWSLQELLRGYGHWNIGHGTAVEIVRRGGNGDMHNSLQDFVNRLEKDDPTLTKTGGYMFDRQFLKDSHLPSTLTLPPYLSTNDALGIFFLGASGSGVVFHKHSDTWNAVVYGKKRWFLYPLSNTPPGGVHHAFAVQDWFDRIYPKLTAKQQPLECVQQGGEILYLPEGFYHATINIGDTVAVALQCKLAKLVAEKYFYQVTDLMASMNYPETDKVATHKQLQNVYLRLREILPESTEVMMKLAEEHGSLGQHQAAVTLLKEVVKMDPYFVLAWTSLGDNLAKLRQFEEADKAFQHAVELSPELWDVYRYYGTFLIERGRYADAIPVLVKGTEVQPGLMQFWQYLKMAQESTGDLEGAKRSQQQIDTFSKH